MDGHAFHGGAPWYDALSGGPARLEREEKFLLKALARAPLPRVLDLACGTGLHALFFADHGSEVTACDLSSEMIETAREKRPHLLITYQVGNMRTPPWGPFGLAICLGNSLSLLPTKEDVKRCFKNTASVLAHDGMFAVQVLNYANPELREPRRRVENKEVDGYQVRATKIFTPREDYTELQIKYKVSGEGMEDFRTEETVRLHHWSADFLKETAQDAKFIVGHRRGDFQSTPYDPETSKDVLFLCRKP